MKFGEPVPTLSSRIRNGHVRAWLIVGVAAVLALTLSAVVVRFAHSAVIADTRYRLEHWVPYFISRTDNLPDMFAAEDVDPADLQEVALALGGGVGEIFQVTLFDATGRQIFSSVEDWPSEHETDLNAPEENAVTAIETRNDLFLFNDGDETTDRPEFYSEIYLPIENERGEMLGAIGLYIDQSHAHHIFHRTLRNLSFVLSLVLALSFGIPALAFVKRAQKAEHASRRASYLARYDTLTNLCNRTAFTGCFRDLLDAAADARDEIAVGYLDIDDFKRINDENGHEAGDRLLIHVAEAIQKAVGDAALVARLGGDEFVFALRDCDTDTLVERVCALMELVRNPIEARGKSISATISVGGYVFRPYRGTDIDFALHRADMALYQAKAGGKNMFRLFRKEFEVQRTERRLMENRLYEALQRGEFEVFYQLLMNSSTGEYNGFEALLRLPDGKGGFVPPGEFIPVAEEMGIITEIGAYVLDRAVQTACNWPDDLVIAVNLSVRQFEDERLVETVRDVLTRHAFPARRLQLEITESLLLENTISVTEQLQDLQMLGVSIAMDDFGTGHSSLGYLWKYNFNKIKIDRSFILEIGKGTGKSREIIETIVNLGHKLDATVTAEGIETGAQAELLRELQCDELQGFHFAHPLPAEDIAKMLQAKKNSVA